MSLSCDQEDEPEDYYRRAPARNRFEEDLEAEAQAERRIINAKVVILSSFNTFYKCTYVKSEFSYVPSKVQLLTKTTLS